MATIIKHVEYEPVVLVRREITEVQREEISSVAGSFVPLAAEFGPGREVHLENLPDGLKATTLDQVVIGTLTFEIVAASPGKIVIRRAPDAE